jgi:hypothetical protein
MFGALHYMHAAQARKRREEAARQEAARHARQARQSTQKKRNMGPPPEPLYNDVNLKIPNPSKFSVPGYIIEEDDFLYADQIIKRTFKSGETFIGYLKYYDSNYGPPPPPRLIEFNPADHELIDLEPLIEERRRAINERISIMEEENKRRKENEKRKANRGILGYLGNCVGSLCTRRHRAGKRTKTLRKH